MDWFSWLSRTNLETSLIQQYSISFTNNELEQEDISYFNHECLQSMGISIAKHRLEIIKLARQDRNKSPLLTSKSIYKAVAAIKKTSKCLSNHVRAWINNREEEESSQSQALVLVPKITNTKKWRGGFLKRRNKRCVMPSNNGNGALEKQERLLLTNGSTPYRVDSFDYSFNEEKLYNDEQDREGTYVVEEIKWDSMFQNLKPN
ncbi:unnamed protein product [Cochlearia groenlandica]